jgi:peptidyl-prolyl cis-trans isomerase B (cyclophilin B)
VKRLGAIGLLFLLGLAACSHREPQPAAAAPVNNEAAFTGVSNYPRAYPVALPVKLPVATVPPPVASASAATATSPPAAMPVPAEPATVDTHSEASSAPVSASATSPAAPALSTYSSVPASESTNAAASTIPASTSAAAAMPVTPDTAPLTAPSAGPPVVDAVPSPSVADQVVVLETTFGRMVIELDDFAAPKTCANFRHLVNTGFYNDTLFHRVIPQFIIQGGDPNTKSANRALYGQGDPGYTLPPEIKLHHDRGAVAMARLPDSVNPSRYSNGSQFYICVAACPSLDAQYTVFAHVIAGLDVAERIATAPADRRSDPVERIAMKLTFEPRDRALRENAATGP